MSDNPVPAGVVLPLDPAKTDATEIDPWQLLAQEQGLLLTWREAPRIEDHQWGPALRGVSALGQQLSTIVTQAGQPGLLSAGSTLFRVELPSGSTLQNLVPAVGGGFRGLVRTADNASIGGHARLIPVAGGATAAGVALGPLVGLMALSVGAEMLARHQQDKKLDSIRRGVHALNLAAEENTRAQLDSAEQALEDASAAILDRIDVPSSIGLGSARTNLRDIKNRGLGWLTEWENRAEKVERGGTGIAYGGMREVLAGRDDDLSYLDFPKRVETLYRSLALDSRAVVLTGAEAALRKENQTLAHLQDHLRRELERNAKVQERLRQLLWSLTSDPVTYSLPARPGTGQKVAQLQRTLNGLAIAAARMPDAPAVLNSSNRQVTEILRKPDGSIHVLAPAQKPA